MRKYVILTVVLISFLRSYAQEIDYTKDFVSIYDQLMEAKMYDRCIAYFDSLIVVESKDPDNPFCSLKDYYERAAYAKLEIKDIDGAIIYFQKASQSPSIMGHSSSFSALSNIYFDYKKDFSKAHQYIDKAISEEKISPVLYIEQKIEIFKKQNDITGGINYTENIIKKYPNKKMLYKMLSILYTQNKMYEKAISTMNKAVQLFPNEAYCYYWRASAKQYAEQYDAAIEDYQKCQDMESDNGRGFEGIAGIYKEKKDYSKAHQYIDKALNINPNNTDLLITKSRIYTAQKNYSQAIATMDKAVGLEPQTANCYYWRAKAKKSGKQYDDAIADYQKFQDLEPSNNAGYRGMEVIYEYYLGKYNLAKQCFNKAIAIETAKRPKEDYIEDFEKSIIIIEGEVKIISQEDIIIELGGKPYGRTKNTNTTIDAIASVEAYKDIPEKNAKYSQQMESYKKNAAIVKKRLGITDSQINACIAYLKYKRSKTKME